MSGAPRIALVAGEVSGDQLGFKLMRALRKASPGVEFMGVGGEAMTAEGLSSLFPMRDIAVMGILPVLARLPALLARIRQTADAIVAARPDVLVIVDSPDFTHRVARRVKAALPRLPVVDYVSPTVWAWRPGRARKMRAYVDRVLALLPFEPEAHRRLGGPECLYVGHPLIERLAELRPNAEESRRREAQPPLVLALPGSRRTIARRLMPDFGAALGEVARLVGEIDIVLPTVPHMEAHVRALAADWPLKPRIVVGEAEKFSAFRSARAALAASGTVTLELALAGVPTVGAYKVSRLEEPLKYLVKVSTILLPNLILEENAVPEILQRDCTPDRLAAALVGVVRPGAARDGQIEAFRRLDGRMRLSDGERPSSRAARLVLELLESRPAGA